MPGLASQDPETYWISSRFLGSKDWKPQIGQVGYVSLAACPGIPQRVEVPDTVPGSRVFLRNFKPVFGEPKVGCGVDAMMAMHKISRETKSMLACLKSTCQITLDLPDARGPKVSEAYLSSWGLPNFVSGRSSCPESRYANHKIPKRSVDHSDATLSNASDGWFLQCRLLHTCYLRFHSRRWLTPPTPRVAKNSGNDRWIFDISWYVNFNKGFYINQGKGWWQLTHFSQKNFVAVLHCFKTLLICILVCVLPSDSKIFKTCHRFFWWTLPFLQTLGINVTRLLFYVSHSDLGHCCPSATSRECSWWQLSPATKSSSKKYQ